VSQQEPFDTARGVDGLTLRQKAEAHWQANQLKPAPAASNSAHADVQALVHNLQVHQIELEMQNEELSGAKTELEESRDLFVDLYDHAPVGYCTVTLHNDSIVQANRTLATWLGVVRSALVHQTFTHCVLPEDQDIFYHVRSKLLAEGGPQTCELRLQKADGWPIWVQMDFLAPSAREGTNRMAVAIAVTDITRHKRAETLLQASEARYRELLTDLQVGVLMQGPHAEILLSNDKAFELLGLTESQMRGQGSFDPRWNVIHEDGSDFPGPDHPVPQAIATRLPIHDVVMGVYRPSTQDRVWLLVNADPKLKPDGSVEHVMCTFQDISARKDAELRLRKSDALSGAVLDSLSALIALVDRQGNVQQVNEAWRRFAHNNRSPAGAENSIGMNYFSVCNCPDGDADQTPRLAAEGLRSVLSGEAPSFELEYPCTTPTQEYWYRMNITPMEGEFGGAVVSHENITEGKLAEIARTQSAERLQLATRAGAVGIWEWDLATDKNIWDEGMYALYGLAAHSFDESFETWSSRIHPDDREEAIAQSRRAAADETVYNTGFRIVRPDGNVRFIRAMGRLLRNEHGRGVHLIGTNWDVTVQKLQEEALHKLLHEKTSLLKEVHHRVKNNLQVITSLLRLETRRCALPEAATVLKTMQGRIYAMAQLHETLYRSGSFASVDLGDYVKQVATQAFQAQLLHGSRVHLKVNSGPLAVSLDQAMPFGLLVNELVANCLKHGFPDNRSGEVCVDLQPESPDTPEADARWCLRVRDTGVGLSPDFETRRENTLGLQLAGDLCHQIGGTLQVHSPAGPGAEFSVTFVPQPIVPLVMP
jgi:PAS domain S-box-containing protein